MSIRPIRIAKMPLPPGRQRAFPPPLPPAIEWPSLLNWKAVAGAGAAALLLVVGVVVWAAQHPTAQTRAKPAPIPVAVAPAPARTANWNQLDPKPEPVVTVSVPAAPDAGERQRPAPALDPAGEVDLAPAGRLALDAAPLDVAPTCQKLGTSVEFDANPIRAAQQAIKAQKLLMVLHVSGNFEESAFT